MSVWKPTNMSLCKELKIRKVRSIIDLQLMLLEAAAIMPGPHVAGRAGNSRQLTAVYGVISLRRLYRWRNWHGVQQCIHWCTKD